MTAERTSDGPIRVGVIGANPDRGWGTGAHLPALAHLPEFRIAAVATTRAESARQTAQAFGVPHAFGRAADLIAHPEVDLVAVTVKVPDHAPLIRAAVAAGKHVYSEWPLGVDLAEARELADAARAAGVVHAVGLQGAQAPAASYVRDLIAEGAVGELRSISLTAASGLGGHRVPESLAWALDPAAGVSALSISGGHVLATLAETVGPLTELTAVSGRLDIEATVIETGARLPIGTPGQTALVGTLAGGALVSVTIMGGVPPAAGGFTLKLVGSEGALSVDPATPGGSIHIAEWRIARAGADGTVEELTVPDRYRRVPGEVPAGPPRNVAAVYAEIARALAEGRQPYPSFDTAVALHRLLEIIGESARTGERRPVR